MKVTCYQVKLGTAKGSKVVKVAVGALYVLLLSLGVFKALPWISVVSCLAHEIILLVGTYL